ncbi:MAG: tetratricopeptide repeat protein [Acidobacteriota bacterium]
MCKRVTLLMVLLSFRSAAPTLALHDSYSKGMELVASARWSEALEVFQEGLRIAPRDARLLNATGALLIKLSHPEQAEFYLKKAVEIAPKFTAARKNLAVAYFESGKDKQAEAIFHELSKGPASKPFAQLFLGLIAEKQGRFHTAVSLLEQSGTLAHQSAPALFALARSHTSLGRPDEAVAVLSRLRALPSISMAERVEAAVLLEGAGRAEEALRLLQNAESAPTSSTMSVLARIAQKAHKPQLAIDALKKAIELEPRNETYYLDLSALCWRHNNPALALEIVAIGIRQIPGSYGLFIQKGVLLNALNRPSEAKETLREAMRLKADHSLALVGLAITHTYSDELDEAIQLLEAGIRKFPGNYYLAYSYGYVLSKWSRQRDDLEAAEQARRLFERAIELRPTFSDSYYQLGKLCLSREPELAASYFERVLQLDPENSLAKYQLARLYLSTGRRQRGLELMDEVKQQGMSELEERVLAVTVANH